MTDKEKVLYDKLSHLEVVVESLLDILIKSDVVDYVELQRVVDENADIILENLERQEQREVEDPEINTDELDDNTIPFYFWGPGGDA